MKMQELRRFLDDDVVGQMRDGLFFEGRITLQAGKAVVVENEKGGQSSINPDSIRWLVRAVRYC